MKDERMGETKPGAIWKRDSSSGTVYLRDGITVAFFLPMPMELIAASIIAAFEHFLQMIPADALRWEAIGASSEEWRPVTKTTFERCRAQLRPEAVRKRSLTSFELVDGENGGDAAGYGIIAIGNPYDPELPDEKNLLQMYFPTEVIDTGQVDHFVENVCTIASMLPYVSGYASPGLHWSELESSKALKAARGIVRRHPGYDVQDNVNTRSDIDTMIRGARWLTFLGPEIVERLGGTVTLRHAVSFPITVREVGHGIMIRAGEQPEIGDLNHQVGTPLLRSMAKVLEPVTLFGEDALLGREFGSPDDDFLERWERRFLD